jgi:pantothenate synthetase
MTALPVARPGARLLAAARLGTVRLIDNIPA